MQAEAFELTKNHELQMIRPSGNYFWGRVVAVSPNWTAVEKIMLKQVDLWYSTGSGTMISECHAATNMHVLFNPFDDLSYGAELARTATVVGLNKRGEPAVTQAETIMVTPSYWLEKDREEAKKQYKKDVPFYRINEDIALIRLRPIIAPDEHGVIRRQQFARRWFPLASAPPGNQLMMGVSAYTHSYIEAREINADIPFALMVDYNCRASYIDKYGYVNMRGTCHVIAGMSGGAIVNKIGDPVLYGLIQGANWLEQGAPKKDQPELYNPEKFANLRLNNYVAIWPHRERILKAMAEHPCERLN